MFDVIHITDIIKRITLRDVKTFSVLLSSNHWRLHKNGASSHPYFLLNLASCVFASLPHIAPIQQLLGHADIATTTIYTRVSADDLARMMGTSEAPCTKTVPHLFIYFAARGLLP
jgi:site-specific recombinase XerC